jgi:hypothetical protein
LILQIAINSHQVWVVFDTLDICLEFLVDVDQQRFGIYLTETESTAKYRFHHE